MSAWNPIANPDGSTNTHGYFYPWPNGWPTLPASIHGLPGAVSFEDQTSPTGIEWFVIKGTPAYNAVIRSQSPPAPKRPVPVSPGAIASTPTQSDRADDQTGEGDPVTEYTNDPALGVVPIGVPTDQTFVRRLWNAPSRAVAKLLPPGSVSETVALGMSIMPWVIWGVVAVWLWRRFRR